MQEWAAFTLKEFEAEWRDALSLSSHEHAVSISPVDDRRSVAPPSNGNVEGAEVCDPFDCSSVVIPSLHELVEETARKHVREWKALDERKINSSAAAPANAQLSGWQPPAKKKKVAMRQDTGMPLWYDHPNRIRLPHRFDYLCRHPTAAAAAAAAAVSEAEASTTAHASTGSKDVPDDPRVQSLVDPTLTTSYRSELWNLFARIPSAEQLRRHTCDDDDSNNNSDGDDDTSADSGVSPVQDTPLSLRRMRKLSSWYSGSSYLSSQQQQKPKQQDQPSAVDDSKCLWTRLRLSDLHEPPLLLFSSSPSSRKDSQGIDLLTTVRFECWRGCASPSRTVLPECVYFDELTELSSSSPNLTLLYPRCLFVRSPDRMSVEFLKSHTLLDFHRVLVEQARDDLWRKLGDDPGDGASSADDGFFFIEDTFYISGLTAVEYAKPIVAWLSEMGGEDGDDDDSRTGGRDRLARLGVPVASVDDLKIVQMSETRLEDLPMRLGIRYAHVHHGNVECSVYCVDRRVQIARSSDEVASWSRMYPILHDVWTSPYNTPTCEACQHRTAALVSTSTCEATDGGPRPLCRSCARLLQVPSSELEVYSIYRAG